MLQTVSVSDQKVLGLKVKYCVFPCIVFMVYTVPWESLDCAMIALHFDTKEPEFL